MGLATELEEKRGGGGEKKRNPRQSRRQKTRGNRLREPRVPVMVDVARVRGSAIIAAIRVPAGAPVVVAAGGVVVVLAPPPHVARVGDDQPGHGEAAGGEHELEAEGHGGTPDLGLAAPHAHGDELAAVVEEGCCRLCLG